MSKGNGHLTLSRKLGQSFQVGDATVEVTRIEPGQVRLTVTAPVEMEIVRTEIVGTAKDVRKVRG